MPGLPVQPVVVRFPHKHLNPSCVQHSNIATLGYRLVSQFKNKMEVEYLPIMEPLPQVHDHQK
jgi:lysophosphatidylcholine acyltransferase/lyso-PAF acetyltransferase